MNNNFIDNADGEIVKNLNEILKSIVEAIQKMREEYRLIENNNDQESDIKKRELIEIFYNLTNFDNQIKTLKGYVENKEPLKNYEELIKDITDRLAYYGTISKQIGRTNAAGNEHIITMYKKIHGLVGIVIEDISKQSHVYNSNNNIVLNDTNGTINPFATQQPQPQNDSSFGSFVNSFMPPQPQQPQPQQPKQSQPLKDFSLFGMFEQQPQQPQPQQPQQPQQSEDFPSFGMSNQQPKQSQSKSKSNSQLQPKQSQPKQSQDYLNFNMFNQQSKSQPKNNTIDFFNIFNNNNNNNNSNNSSSSSYVVDDDDDDDYSSNNFSHSQGSQELHQSQQTQTTKISELLNAIAEYEKKISKEHTDCDANMPMNKWYFERDINGVGHYYRVDKTGKKNEASLTIDNTCKALGLDENKCLKLVGILSDENKTNQVANLKDFIKGENNIITLANNTLKQIHPKFVLEILHAFDFTFDPETKMINSVDNWLRNVLPKYFDNKKADMNKFIVDNSNLLDLLACFVNFINNNQGILHPEEYYTKDTYEQRLQNIIPDVSMDKIYSIQFDNTPQAIKYFGKANAFTDNSNSLLRFLIDGPNISGLVIPGQYGGWQGQYGGANPSVMVDGTSFRFQLGGFNNSNPECGSQYARNMYNKFKHDINSCGKQLAKKDEDNFNKMLNNLKRYETEVHKYLSNINAYIKNNGDVSNTREVVTQREMQEYIKNYKMYNQKYQGQENRILRALFKIASYSDNLDSREKSRNREIVMEDII